MCKLDIDLVNEKNNYALKTCFTNFTNYINNVCNTAAKRHTDIHSLIRVSA